MQNEKSVIYGIKVVIDCLRLENPVLYEQLVQILGLNSSIGSYKEITEMDSKQNKDLDISTKIRSNNKLKNNGHISQLSISHIQ